MQQTHDCKVSGNLTENVVRLGTRQTGKRADREYRCPKCGTRVLVRQTGKAKAWRKRGWVTSVERHKE